MSPKLDDFGISVAEIFYIEKGDPLPPNNFLIWNFTVSKEDIEDGWHYGDIFNDLFEKADYRHVFSSRRVSV